MSQKPVIENQAPAGEVTKIIGAKHGAGNLMAAEIVEFPSTSAGKFSVLILTSVTSPSSPMLRQLTSPRKFADGFISVETKTKPLTSTSSCPSDVNWPTAPPRTTQGAPPAAIPRMGFRLPIKGPEFP